MLQTTKELMLVVDVTAVWVAISLGSSVFLGDEQSVKWAMQ